MPLVPDFKPFSGVHCETVATGNLLRHAGLDLSEPMLFGLGEGIGFAIFVQKNQPAPFIGGRVRPENITKALARNLSLDVAFRQTRSARKAWANMASFIDAGHPVAIKLDCYYLDYFSSDFHFAAHYVAAYGYDNTQIFVVDTQQQGGARKTSRARFQEGRLWKGPMASNALSWTVTRPKADPDWHDVLTQAIRANAQAYTTPPIRNFGARGIRKAATLIPGWKDTVAPDQIALTGQLIEDAGTGGGLFRRLYADFLTEANEVLHSDLIAEAADLIRAAGGGWTHVSLGLQTAGTHPGVLDDVAQRLLEISEIETRAFELLARLGA